VSVELFERDRRAPSSRVANARNCVSLSRNASSSPSVLLYGLPPTIASLE
jgi:hypothetical protein